MDKQPLYIIIGVLAGVILGIFIARYAVNTQNYGMMNMMGMGAMMQKGQNSMTGEEDMHGMSMNQMSSTLTALNGEDFDRMFIELMIEHHQGAIDMAELVLTNSERPELKNLANDIISAQSKEIEMMKGWLESWY
ncbi:MAG: DUF305 domain-containing protein [Patescibacteria group bacterium]